MTKFELLMVIFMIVQIGFTFGILTIINQYKKGKYSVLIEDISSINEEE